MQNQNRKFGLIGFPLGHSYSKNHFTRKFEREGLAYHSYENFEIPSVDQIVKIIRTNRDLIGLNVTIPYKQAVMRFLDELDPVAEEIGAVNTIRISRTGTNPVLCGYNTDAEGFTRSLARWSPDRSLSALVFGTGGSSLAVKYALEKMGIRYLQVSRTPMEGGITYGDLTRELAAAHLLWINCTPVGMFPRISEKLPLPYEYLTPAHYLYDLVYNPEITEFLKMGIKAGSSTLNGSAMLYEQAEASWRIWNAGSL
jgi:shikimate dehydrogenase